MQAWWEEFGNGWYLKNSLDVIVYLSATDGWLCEINGMNLCIAFCKNLTEAKREAEKRFAVVLCELAASVLTIKEKS